MMQEFAPGQLVISKTGRDKGRYFTVLKTEGKFVYITDGDLRKVENPKKKNSLHLKHTNIFLQDIAEKIAYNTNLRNADLRRAIAMVIEVPRSEVGGGR